MGEGVGMGVGAGGTAASGGSVGMGVGVGVGMGVGVGVGVGVGAGVRIGVGVGGDVGLRVGAWTSPATAGSSPALIAKTRAATTSGIRRPAQRVGPFHCQDSSQNRFQYEPISRPNI